MFDEENVEPKEELKLTSRTKNDSKSSKKKSDVLFAKENVKPKKVSRKSSACNSNVLDLSELNPKVVQDLEDFDENESRSDNSQTLKQKRKKKNVIDDDKDDIISDISSKKSSKKKK